MHIANYLTKSRHGIWYYRWVVPLRIRASHPALPKELKRSTKTADIRLARVRARRFHESIALPYMNADDLSNLLADAQRQQFMLERDPVTGRVVRIQAEPHEWEAAVAAVKDRRVDDGSHQWSRKGTRPEGNATTVRRAADLRRIREVRKAAD